jgi:nitroreductase
MESVTATQPTSLGELLAQRHSSRAFLDKPVPDDVLESIFRRAQLSPSSCNSQPWHVYLTKDAGTRRLAAALSEHVLSSEGPEPDIDLNPKFLGVHLDRKRACGMALYASLGIERTDYAARQAQMHKNFTFFGAPHALIVTSEKLLGPAAILDTGGYVATLSLLAQQHGIGSVLQGAVSLYASFLHTYFGIPDSEAVVASIALGYEDNEHPVNLFRTERAGITEVVRTFDH